MGNRVKSGTRRLGLFVAMLFATVLMAPSFASAADTAPVVGNPGENTMEITGGFLKVGSTLEAPLNEEDLPTRPTFDAQISPDGTIFVPKTGFHFPHMIFPVEDVPIVGDLDIGIDIIATHDVTGQINPETGLLDLSLRFKIKATTSGLADVGNNCTIGTDAAPLTLNMSSATGIDPSATPGLSLGGIPYNQDTGRARVADKSFTAPGQSGCSGLAAGQINDLLGLPSPAGANSAEFGFAFTPSVVPAIEVRYSGDPLEAKVPFEVEFDASNTVSRVGDVTEYRWDFDGDGEVDEVTNGPTATHTYTTAGIYQTRLTIVTDAGEITRGGVTITAKSIDVIFTEKPPVSSTSRDAHFEFESNEPEATFECRLDVGDTEGTYEPCTSPIDFTDLPDNDYKFMVRATVGEDTGLPAVVPFRVDNVAPEASITGQPNSPVGGNITEGTVSFAANEEVTFECRFTPTGYEADENDGDEGEQGEAGEEGEEGEEPSGPQFEPCTSPTDVSWQAVEGTNTFEVRPTDLAGNVGEIVTATWVVDLTPPVPVFLSGPPSPTNGVGSTAATRKCTLQIIICLSYEDTQNPGNTAHAFTFTANEPVVSWTCQFNDGAERPCVSGIQTGLGWVGPTDSSPQDINLRTGMPVEGVNTLKIWGVDQAGNRTTEPAVRTFVYDTTPPVITALAVPPTFTKSTQNTVIFQSNEPVTQFECRTVNNTGSGTTSFATGTGNATGFAPCTPGMLNPTLGWYTAVGQTDGRKGVQVRATDQAGNTHTTNNNVLNNGGLTVYWTVDNAAPTVSFGAGSQQQNSYTTSTNATFNLSATDTPINFGTTANNIAAQQPSYECSLDNAAFTACTTPVQLSELNPGQHNFRVRVNDAAANQSTVIERNWTVVAAGNQSVTLDSTPPAVSGSRDVTYEFSPDNGTAECRIDATEAQNQNGTGWAPCASPKTFTGLAEGNHQVEIRADSSSVPAVHNFAVYANLPTVTVGGLPGLVRSGTRYTGLEVNSASITLTAPANPAFAPGATTFECRYYESTATVPPFEPCTSPYQVNWNKLDHGKTMRFEVRPVSSTGNIGATSTSDWTIVATKPAVSLGGPAVATACFNGAAGGPGAAGCVATGSSTQPGLRSNVAQPRFQATTSKPVAGVIGFACQLNNGAIQNPCTGRTTGISNPERLTVVLGGSRGTNNDNFGTALTQNAQNTFRIWAVDEGGNMSDPVEYTWVHDNTPPTFAITSPTPARTNAGTEENPLEVEILANEDMATNGAHCRLIANGTATTNGTSPGSNPNSPASGYTFCGGQTDERHFKWTATNLAEGNYALDIRGFDLVWNVATGTSSSTRPATTDNNANGRRYIFTIDRTPPTTNITGGPAEGSTVGQKSATFTFTTNEAANTEGSECRIDPEDPDDLEGGWEPCSSPLQLEDLEDGAHTIQIRSWDNAGNHATTPVTRNWNVDSTAPTIELKSSIEGHVTNQTSIVFGQLSDPEDATVECRLLTPEDLREPEEGEEPPAEVEWTTDCGEVIVPEEPPVDDDNGDGDQSGDEPGDQSGDEPGDESGDESGDQSGDEPGDESGDEPGDDEPVEEPDPFRYLSFTDLSDGNYRFEVRATNDLNVTSDVVSFAWTVDTVAPQVEITSGPNAATKNTEAEFEFTSDDESATFECALDDGEAEACESPVSYDSLADGDHTVTVTATDEAGNTSEPATRSWSIDTVKPVTTITSGPTGTVNVNNASFEFDSDKEGSTFECKLDTGDWEACTSPKAVSGLANGEHTISVRATDTLGNLGEAASRTWTVQVEDPKCPDGQVGNPPNCSDPVCPEGQVGDPNTGCYDPCPAGWTGTPPNCVEPVKKANLAKVVVAGPKKVKRGKQFTVRASIKNNGDGAATNVKVCIKTPKRFIAGKANRCRTIKTIAAGATGKVTFKLKAKKAAKKAKKVVKLTVTAPTGEGLASGKRIHKPTLFG